MPPKPSSQKFIGRNRPPRVQIEFDLETGGATRKIELPFVMGVMADLSGKPSDPLKPLDKRDFVEIDAESFDTVLKGTKPRAAFQVPNTLTGEGNLMVDISFEKLEDFEPHRIAAKIEPLRQLLEARTQLSNLLTYMDGKSDLTAMVGKILADPALLKSVTDAPKPADGGPKEGA